MRILVSVLGALLLWAAQVQAQATTPPATPAPSANADLNAPAPAANADLNAKADTNAPQANINGSANATANQPATNPNGAAATANTRTDIVTPAPGAGGVNVQAGTAPNVRVQGNANAGQSNVVVPGAVPGRAYSAQAGMYAQPGTTLIAPTVIPTPRSAVAFPANVGSPPFPVTEQWRVTYKDNYWWYLMPNDHWVYFDGARWIDVAPTTAIAAPAAVAPVQVVPGPVPAQTHPILPGVERRQERRANR